LLVSAALKPEYDENGWFSLRLDLALIEYERGSELDNANVMCCVLPESDSVNLLAK